MNLGERANFDRAYREYVLLMMGAKAVDVTKSYVTKEEYQQLWNLRLQTRALSGLGFEEATTEDYSLDVLAQVYGYAYESTEAMEHHIHRIREHFYRDVKEYGVLIAQWRAGNLKAGSSDLIGLLSQVDFNRFKTMVEKGFKGTYAKGGGDTTVTEALAPYFTYSETRLLEFITSFDRGAIFAGDGVKRATYLLDHLHAQGLAYQLVPENKVGRVTVQLDSGARLRVLDGADMNSYETAVEAMSVAERHLINIGRVTDKGYTYRFKYTRPGQEPWIPNYNQLTMNLELALGTFVGGYKTNYNKNYDRTAQIGEGRFHVALDGNFNGREGLIVEVPRFRGPTFDTAEAAEAFVKEQIRNHNQRLRERLDIEGIMMSLRSGEPYAVSSGNSFARELSQFHEIAVKAYALYKAGLLHEVNPLDFNDVIYDSASDTKVNFELPKDAVIPTDAGVAVFISALRDAYLESHFASFEKGFIPGNVMRTMPVNDPYVSNSEMMVRALKACNYHPELLLDNDEASDGYYSRSLKDRAIQFNPSTAVGLAGMDHPMGQNALQTVVDTLQNYGLEVNENDVLMDDQGIIYWEAVRHESVSKKISGRKLSGSLGQIFLPDRGVIETKFGGKKDYEFVPGSIAHLTPLIRRGTFRERHRVTGYEQLTLNAIRYNIAKSIMANATEVASGHIDRVTDNNNVYSKMYERRFELGELDHAVMTGDIPEAFANAVRKTLAGRVRYDAKYMASTTGAVARMEYEGVIPDGSVFSAFEQTELKNLRAMDKSMDAVFDPLATGTAKNQGMVRYLVKNALINSDGTLTESEEVYTELLQQHEFANCIKYNQWGRIVMAMQQAITAKRIAHNVGTVMASFGGFNVEDGVVISQRFAEANMITDSNGELRALMRGDKISDFNGNKGVVTLIVDPLKSATEQTHHPKLPMSPKAVAFFKNNPTVDVVMSPFSPISRANGGAIRDLMSRTEELVVDGKVYKGAIGYTNYIITDKTVDEKTHRYDEIGDKAGRRASGQLAWALNSQGCSAILDYIYEGNKSAFEDFREYLIVAGLDVAADGTLKSKYTPHYGEKRPIFRMKSTDATKRPTMDVSVRTSAYASTVETYKDYEVGDGWDQVLYRSYGAKTNSLIPSHQITHPSNGATKAFLKEIEDKGGFLEVPWPLEFYSDLGMSNRTLNPISKEDGSVMYQMPIIAPELRKSQLMQDELSLNHNFTKGYGRVYEQLYMYNAAKDVAERLALYQNRLVVDMIEKYNGFNDAFAAYKVTENKATKEIQAKAIENLMTRFGKGAQNLWKSYLRAAEMIEANQAMMKRSSKEAQRHFTVISKEITDYYINGKDGKYSHIRDRIMGRMMKNTATAVCIGDPRLDLDTISMNKRMMRALGIADEANPQILIWRDPIIKDGGLRYMKMIHDPTIEGIGIHPSATASFNMDFDGDTAGLMVLRCEKAKAEALEKLTPQANMVETGVKNGAGMHPLYFGLDQDVQMYIHNTKGEKVPWLKADIDRGAYLKRIEYEVNKGSLDGKTAFKHVNMLVKDACDNSYGATPLRFGSFDDLHEDFNKIIESKAKGSESKRDILYYWMNVSVNEDGKVVDLGELPEDRRERILEVQAAEAMKADLTGSAGVFAQRLMQVFRNIDPKMAMELVEPVTQAVLSIKGNAAHAKQIDRIIRTDMREILYKGMPPNPEADFVETRIGKNGKPNMMPLKRDDFVRELHRLMTDAETGLGVKTNIDYIEKIADVLVAKDGMDKGRIRPLAEVGAKLGTPMDLVAYNDGGRVDRMPVTPLWKLLNFAKAEANLFGKERLSNGRINYSWRFAPKEVRGATPTTCIIKESCKVKDVPKEMLLEIDSDVAKRVVQTHLRRENALEYPIPDHLSFSDDFELAL